MPTIGQFDSGRRNNFDLIRFIAASAVIFSHSFLITGQFNKEPLNEHFKFINFGSIGVYIFFTISGYLITKSFFRQQDAVSYIKARCLRIFPALTVAVLFCAVIVGPLLTTLSASDYLTTGDVYRYIGSNVFLVRVGGFLPGVFDHNTLAQCVNNPIWTLPTELLMYIVIFLFGILYIRWTRRHQQFRINLLVFGLVVVYLCLLMSNFTMRYLHEALLWIIFFVLGTLVYLLRDRIPMNLWWMGLTWLVTAAAIGWRLPGFKPVFALTLVYTIFTIGFHPRLYAGHFSKYGDFSYGLYVYGFPIQQTVSLFYPAWSPWLNFALSFPITLALAVLSWHLIEKPCMRLKEPKTPKARLA